MSLLYQILPFYTRGDILIPFVPEPKHCLSEKRSAREGIVVAMSPRDGCFAARQGWFMAKMGLDITSNHA